MWGKVLGAMVGAAAGFLLGLPVELLVVLGLAGLAVGHLALDREPGVPRSLTGPTEAELLEELEAPRRGGRGFRGAGLRAARGAPEGASPDGAHGAAGRGHAPRGRTSPDGGDGAAARERAAEGTSPAGSGRPAAHGDASDGRTSPAGSGRPAAHGDAPDGRTSPAGSGRPSAQGDAPDGRTSPAGSGRPSAQGDAPDGRTSPAGDGRAPARRYATGEDATPPSSLAEALSPLLVALARTDGPVARSEVRVIRELLEDELGEAPGPVRQEIRAALGAGAGDLVTLARDARRELSPAMRLTVVRAMYELVAADQEPSRQELDAIRAVAVEFNLSEEQRARIAGEFFPDRAAHLATLGLEEPASEEDIRAAYRRLAAEYHPDRFTGKSAAQARAAEERFREVQAAHEALRRGRG